MPPTLSHHFTLRAIFSKNLINVKQVLGEPQRTIVPLTSGFLKGSGLEATIPPGSGDWFLLEPNNTGHLNVRLNLQSLSGHGIYIHYEGILVVDETVLPYLMQTGDAKTTEFGDHELSATPTMETSDPEYKWVESAVWVAEGRMGRGLRRLSMRFIGLWGVVVRGRGVW